MLVACTALAVYVVSTGTLLAAADQPFFSSDATFVLISGLPGDTESENAFQDQLRGWVDLLSADGRSKRLLVFCDQPAAITPSETLQKQVFKANREQLLKLPELLGSNSEPLRVIVWGHGGKQAATPVLHVRGPRLTPSDFSTLSAGLTNAPSQWVLLFRGSGAFARALARPGREVLASDDETFFDSDPQGLPLFLKVARANPAASFDRLTESFGRVAFSWYAERNLVSNEELTLWADGQDPRHLADKGKVIAKEDSEQTDQHKDSPRPMASDRDSSKVKAAADSANSNGWNNVKKVDPQQYPDADAVVLQSRYVSVLGSSPALVTEREEYIQILRPEGKRFGDFDVSFAPPEEELEFLDCEVLRPDGTEEQLDPDGIGIAGDHSPGEYQTVRRKFFSLPGVVPGAVLHVRYRSQWKDYPLPRVSLTIPVGRDLPVLDSTIVVRYPKGSPFHYGFENIKAGEPKVDQTSYSTSYTWHLADVPATADEPLSPPHRRVALLVSTFPDWQAFADWYSHISQLMSELSPELEQKAKELTRNAKTPREQVEAVFNYVTGLRYVAVPLGINSIRPHSAVNVLENQFGDCKDKANLLNTLLQALNIDANLVLVPRFSQADQNLPGLSFNHAISRVRLGNEILWLDSTDEVCRFGLLPPGDSGRKVLIIDGKTSALTQLATADASQNRLTIHGKLQWSDLAQGCPVELDASTTGFADYQLRSAAQHEREQGGSVGLLAAVLRPAVGAFALEKQRATSVSALDSAFEWHGQGNCVGLTWNSQNKSVFHSPFWIPREWDLALNHRQAPLFLNEGYPLVLEENFEVTLPADVQPTALPQPIENSHPPLSWRIDWKKKDQATLVAEFRAELARGELSTEDTASFQNQLSELLRALGTDVLCSGQDSPRGGFKTSQK